MPRKANIKSIQSLIRYNIEKRLNEMLNDMYSNKKPISRKMHYKKLLLEANDILNSLSLDELRKKGITSHIINNIQGEGIKDIYNSTKKAIGSVYSGVTNKIKTITKNTYDSYRKSSLKINLNQHWISEI